MTVLHRLAGNLRQLYSRMQFRVEAIEERDGKGAVTGAGIWISYLMAKDIARVLAKAAEVIEPTTAGRTPKDYAIEFGEDLATAAERYMAAVNRVELVREFSDEVRDDAAEARTEAWRALQSAIYEFRKRRDRV